MGASASTLSDAELVALALQAGLKVYAGFRATERRLVFVYGDGFQSRPKLFTILPTGDIEGPSDGKTLPPQKEKGLVTYPFPQFLNGAQAQAHLNTHCVWKTADGRYPLVQTWTINVNDEFRKNFAESTSNPDETYFQPAAVENFYSALVGLFGEEARDSKIRFCTKDTLCIDRTYVGSFEQFQQFLNAPGVKESLGIEKVTDDAFTARTLDKKGNVGSKTFSYGKQDGVEQVMYKRNGYTSFMCTKSRAQFEEDCKLHGQIMP